MMENAPRSVAEPPCSTSDRPMISRSLQNTRERQLPLEFRATLLRSPSFCRTIRIAAQRWIHTRCARTCSDIGVIVQSLLYSLHRTCCTTINRTWCDKRAQSDESVVGGTGLHDDAGECTGPRGLPM